MKQIEKSKQETSIDQRRDQRCYQEIFPFPFDFNGLLLYLLSQDSSAFFGILRDSLGFFGIIGTCFGFICIIWDAVESVTGFPY